MPTFMRTILLLIIFTLPSISLTAQSIQPGWPEVTAQTKPWTRWWWHGSAVTPEGITQELEALKKAGIGGVEITPIYGVYGCEKQFVDYLSPQWMTLLDHVLKEATRLGLGVDMATGTGWPFGGPWVKDEDAAKNFQYKVYELASGQQLPEKIEFVQQPYLRAIGSLIYEMNKDGEVKLKDPLEKFQSKKIDIRNIQSPIEKNTDLQAYAFDQVQFERKLPLVTLMGYNDKGKALDLTRYVDKAGVLKWKAPNGKWKLYALFQGWHGKMVERAAPGGEGNVVDHFSPEAIKHYFDYFDKAIQGHDIESLRAFFNDSYEVDDAKGAADFTPALFDEFQKRREYDLRLHLPALLGEDSQEKNERILSDYRQTVSELLQDHFTKQWKAWASSHHAIIRNQAHGSPANILDLYGIVDIPEIEGTEPLRIKMASSAGNVTGKQLVSSESATWLDEHFQSNLHQIKEALDRFMLNGVNHLFYHGTTYSPPNEPWPGWLFYAAVELNSRNPQWEDFSALNAYISRCQSFLQRTKPANDILLYYPVYDRFAAKGPKMLEHFDGVKQFEGSSFVKTAEWLSEENYGFDYISDAQLNKTFVGNNKLITEGKAGYKTLIVPACKYIPLGTLEQINRLRAAGAKVIFVDAFPETFSGFSKTEISAKRFSVLKEQLKSNVVNGNLQSVLKDIIIQEVLPQGLSFIKKQQSDGTLLYFVNNNSDKRFDGWMSLQQGAKSAVLYNPMTDAFGKGEVKSSEGESKIYVQLGKNESILVQYFDRDVAVERYPYYSHGESFQIGGSWDVQFVSGGPAIPQPLRLQTLSSWTNSGGLYSDFSGTAVYRTTFPKPKKSSEGYLLDLGEVRESASVTLNGKMIGTLIGPEYKIVVDGTLLRDNNTLEVRVSNLMANRIAWMDRNNVFWKKFYNVNVAAWKPENRLNGIFDASKWTPLESGLIGPVTLTVLVPQVYK